MPRRAASPAARGTSHPLRIPQYLRGMLGVFGSARYLDFLSYGHNGKMPERVDRTRTRDDDSLVKAMRYEETNWTGEMMACLPVTQGC